MAAIIHVGDMDAWKKVLKKGQDEGKPVVVDFWAQWCGPCRMIKPYFEELSGMFGDAAIFVSVDVDAAEAVAAECGVSAMPTFMVFKGGVKAEELVGASKEGLKQLIQSHALVFA